MIPLRLLTISSFQYCSKTYLKKYCSLPLAGIVSDLFPKMKEEVVDYGALESSIRNSCLQLGLQDVDGKNKFNID